jgi:hypothetical protein
MTGGAIGRATATALIPDLRLQSRDGRRKVGELGRQRRAVGAVGSRLGAAPPAVIPRTRTCRGRCSHHRETPSGTLAAPAHGALCQRSDLGRELVLAAPHAENRHRATEQGWWLHQREAPSETVGHTTVTDEAKKLPGRPPRPPGQTCADQRANYIATEIPRVMIVYRNGPSMAPL